MATVRVKFADRLLKLRPQSVTSRNLAMIFKLDSNRGIYLNCEEEGEIILPSTEDGDGRFLIENFAKTYIVNGDVVATASAQNTQIGVPLSYQVAHRPALNPPPCGGPLQRGLERPQFRTPATGPIFKPKKTKNQWKKAFTVIEVNRMGDINEKFQIHLQLNEDTASVNGIQELLSGQLGYRVSLLDSKYLPVMPGETTTGKIFSTIFILLYMTHDILIIFSFMEIILYR